jgi:hypothetical protein
MRKDILLSNPSLVEPFITPAVAAAAQSNAPFQSQTSYHALTAYLYVLEGSTHAVHERLPLPVSLLKARRSLRLRRRRSMGCSSALPFLRFAPTLGLSEGDIAILEVLALIERTESLARRWGNPAPLRLLAWLLCDDQRVLAKRLRGALSAWSLIHLTHNEGSLAARLTPRTTDLFSAMRQGEQTAPPDATSCAPAPVLLTHSPSDLHSCTPSGLADR